MGGQISRPADQQPLFHDTDDEPIIEKMSIVVIGHHGVGKNTVGNALLKKEAFTFSKSFKKYYLKDENTTFNRHVTVTRVPGWAEELNSNKNMQLWQVIKDSVWSVDIGPHAIILVNKNTAPAQTTKQKLKDLLGDDVFQHILIVSVHARHIVVHHNDGKQTIINRCRLHLVRCTCGDQNRILIETVEDFIVGKHDIRFCFMRKRESTSELQRQELANLVHALKCKISALSASLKSNQDTIERKNSKIRKLHRLLKEKEDMLRAKHEDIERLMSNQNHAELSVQRILQLEQAAQNMKEEHQRKAAEMQKELERRQRIIENLKKDIQALKYKNENEIYVKPSFITGPWYRGTSVELLPVTSTEESLSGSKTVQVSEDDRRVQFLKNSRKELTERIVAVMPIADDLLQFIGKHKHEKILQASPEYEQRRRLLDIIYKGGRKPQIEFYKSLLKHEKYLVEELEESLYNTTCCMLQESKVS